MHPLTLCSLLGAALLLACGAGPSPSPDPTPTPTPGATRHPEVDPATLATWPLVLPAASERSPPARLLTTSGTGALAFTHSNGWRVQDGPLHPLDEPALLMAWSLDGTQLGMIERRSGGYALRIFDAASGAQVEQLGFELPKPDTRGDYPDPSPNHLSHSPVDGGWAVRGSLGRFVISAGGATPGGSPRQERDRSSEALATLSSSGLTVPGGTLPLPCAPSEIVWHSGWDRLAIRCGGHGANSLHLLTAGSATVLRSIELGALVSNLGLEDAETVVALDGGALLRWNADGVSRVPSQVGAAPGCHPRYAAAAVLEPIAVSPEEDGMAYVIGPAVGGRWSAGPGRLAAVSLADCSVTVADVPGQLVLNNPPVWVSGLQGFVAELNRDGAYGPAIVRVSDPGTWSHLLAERADPHLYSVSPDGTGVAIGSFEDVWLFEVAGTELTLTAQLPAAEYLRMCDTHLARWVRESGVWIVNDRAGSPVGVIKSREQRIGCGPVPWVLTGPCERLLKDYLRLREELNSCTVDTDCEEIYPGLCPHGPWYSRRDADRSAVEDHVRTIYERCTPPECEAPMELGPGRCVSDRCVPGGSPRR